MNWILEELHNDGIVVLPIPFKIQSFVEYLSRQLVYQNHVRQNKPDPVPLGSHPWTCHDMGDVTRAPLLLEAALSVHGIARAYLDSKPYLYSLNAFYCEPNANPKPDIQDWHRDADDTKFLALFIYGTDVLTDDDGPHQFAVGTQRGGEERRRTSVYGTAGTMFLADTSGLHRGLVPKTNRRMLAWARWGVSCPPASYQWDGLKPLPKAEIGERYPSDPELQEAIKLVVA